MSTVTAMPIHSGRAPSDRLPILKRTDDCPGDRSEDTSGIVGTSQVLREAMG
jgi:hypothetical protein